MGDKLITGRALIDPHASPASSLVVRPDHSRPFVIARQAQRNKAIEIHFKARLHFRRAQKVAPSNGEVAPYPAACRDEQEWK